ncbi:MAG: DedA family protein [Thermoleophilaceae bacterium]|nr:DedA family protein [Thermoleophilaceae bacterium]
MLDPFKAVRSGSALAYVIITGSIAGSAVFPVLPSETMIFTAGAAAGAGALQVPLVMVAGAFGSLLGDVLGYAIGRLLGERALERFARGERGRRSVGWAQRTLVRRGGPLVAVGRFIPGGQTAVSLTAGSLGFPLARYAVFASIGAVVWGVYGTLVGALGAGALQSGQWVGLAIAVALVLAVAGAAQVVRRRQRRHDDDEAGDDP